MTFHVLGQSGFIGSHWAGSVVSFEEAEVVVNLVHTTSRAELRQLASRLAGRRVVHISSMAVYEPFATGMATVGQPLLPPLDDVYACSKLAAEEFLRETVSELTILRPSIVYGVGSRWALKPLQRVPRRAHGRMQPVSVEELVGVIRSVPPAGVYNVPGPEVMTWRAFFERTPRAEGPALPPDDYFTRDRLIAGS